MKRLVCGIAVAVLAVATPGAAQQGVPDARVRLRQQQIATMEKVLVGAVQNGVNNLRARVRAIMPADALLQDGLPEVRGFPIEGFGVFFDVEVPALRQSVAWTIQQMNRSNMLLARDLAQLRQFAATVEDPATKARLERVVENIQRQIGPVPDGAIERQAVQAAATPVTGTVSAQSLTAGAGAAGDVDPQLVLDPDEAYTQEVKDALVSAMIVYGGPLQIGADEWLTVAARDNAPINPLVQSDSDFRTIMFRIKGSDLLEYQTQRLTLDQVKARVTIQEF